MITPKNIKEAREIQRRLARKVKIIPLNKRPAYIAGVDAAFSGKNIIAAACLFTYPGLLPVEETCAVADTPFPYVPGFLSFREGPAVIEAIHRLKIKPGLVLFDGQGIAHPTGMGIASHIGALLDIPSIGCAKSRLVGDYREPGEKKGRYTGLYYKCRKVGVVLRTRDNVKPLFVSPGHLTDIRNSIDIVLGCTGRYRIPEPLRHADTLSKKAKREINHRQ